MAQIRNRNSIFAYDSAAAVVAGASALLSKIDVSSYAGPHELSLRFGVSDPAAAWAANSSFSIIINGLNVMDVTDQIASLLLPVSIPLELTGKDVIEIVFVNRSAVSLDVAIATRIDKS